MTHHPRTPKCPFRRENERGVVLVVALFTLATLMLVATGGMLVTSSTVRATRNYRGSAQVRFAAESAISEALQIINGPGLVAFDTNVVAPWTGIYGTADKSFAPFSGFTYYVTPFATPGNAANAGRLVATARGTEGVQSTVVAQVLRSNIPSTAPGAIYLAADTGTNATFYGDAFLVDGSDHNYTGGAGPAPPVPGISTRNDTNTQETVGSLSIGQKDNLLGLGFSVGPPTVPSVATSPAAPTVTQVNDIAAAILTRPGVVTNGASTVNGNVTFGTTASPQITYFPGTGGVTIKGTGNASGAGILIIEGDLTIQGSLDFKGLVIVRGKTLVTASEETLVTGNATVYGSIWTNDVNLNVGGSAIVYYSSQALSLANQVGGGGALPSPLTVVSLADCSQLPAGAGGCP
jgi:hypothetical protein